MRRRYGLIDVGSDFQTFISRDTTFGNFCRIGGPVYIADSTISDYTYVEIGARITAASVGKFCSIAPYAFVGQPEHPTTGFVSTHPIFYRSIPALGYDFVEGGAHQEVKRTGIGNDVWIGAGAVVRSGLTVGDGVVVGAGAVVTKDLDPYTIYAGVPARPIRRRFDDDTIAFLREFRWWDRGDDWLQSHAREMQDVRRLKDSHSA